jgi:hypothetical protein
MLWQNNLYKFVLFSFAVASAATMSVTKYTEPIPAGAIIMETWEQVKSLTTANPQSGLMGDIGEAHYLQDDEGVILGVASDELCLEIDARISSAMRAIEARTEMGDEDGTVGGSDAPGFTKSEDNAVGPISQPRCSHPRCYYSVTCQTYSYCHFCLTSKDWCI